MTSERVSIRIAAAVLVAALPALAHTAAAAAAPPAATAGNGPVLVNLRVEGSYRTIFEGTVATYGRKVTTPAGGTHHCDGTNNGSSPVAGATATTALDDASKQGSFDYDGYFQPGFDDFVITRIGPDNQTGTQSWSLLDNWRVTALGGCAVQPATGDEILWAYDATAKAHLLKLTGPRTAHLDEPYPVTVTDGATGEPIPDATVTATTADGTTTVSTDATGTATFTPGRVGVARLKADRADSVRSNEWAVVALPSLRT
jgi:hypothetical protein